MMGFLKTRAGQISVVAFVLLMAFAFMRVAGNRRERLEKPMGAAVASTTTPAGRIPESGAAGQGKPLPGVAADAAYLQNYYATDTRAREDHDKQGNPVTRRENAGTPSESGRETIIEPAAKPARAAASRGSLRLQGRAVATTPRGERPIGPDVPPPEAITPPARRVEAAAVGPTRFNPYGSVLKCELVFTIDSTNEQTPLVGIVMEPVFNNGRLVIPAGAELHGVARPDRLRDRIFSGLDWVMVFPRENGRPNGRQLAVKGVALDRVEPQATGVTWGITDGSYGLQGRVIRSMNDAEIKRFLATFLGAGSVALQERQTERSGQQSIRNTPANAALQGFAANFEKIAEEISAEIGRHGVFIRVPAGHQFYFYPMQIIDPELAAVPSLATASK